MEKVTETATFFKAIDGTKFFLESECDKYEKEHSKETLEIIRRELAEVSSRLSYYKEWVLPTAEKNLVAAKATFVEKRDKGEWANVSKAYLEFRAKVFRKAREVTAYKKLRTVANELIRRKNELQTIDTIKNNRLYNFDDVFGPRANLRMFEIKEFKTWAGDKATAIAEKGYWGRLYAQYLNSKKGK